MGGLSSRFFGQPQFQVVVMGLDNAGKTTMLHTMKNRQGGQIEMTIPTVGLNVKTLEFQGSAKFLTLQAFDLGGRNNFRPLMRHWFAKTDGIILVVDSNDRRRLEDAKFELHRILAEDNLYGKPLLVLANKQDLTGAAKMSDMVDGLSLHSLRNRRWYIEEIQRFQCWILLCISLVVGRFVEIGFKKRSSHSHSQVNRITFCHLPGRRPLPRLEVVSGKVWIG